MNDDKAFWYSPRWSEMLQPGVQVHDILAQLEERDRKLEDFLIGFASPTTYTVTWTASANPAIGNGTLKGEWRRYGRSGVVDIHLKAGSTTTFGTGIWNFSLPAGWVAVDDTTTGSNGNVGGGFVYDTSGGAPYVVAPYVYTAANVINLAYNGNFVGGTVPMTWAQSDQMHISVPVKLA